LACLDFLNVESIILKMDVLAGFAPSASLIALILKMSDRSELFGRPRDARHIHLMPVPRLRGMAWRAVFHLIP